MSSAQTNVDPFLKWAGGKRWLVQSHSHLLPTTFGRYIEPFLGSGTVFFHLAPQRALLGDSNADLVAAYRALKDDWKKVVRLLRRHQSLHDDHYYYRVRRMAPVSMHARAARLIYLNRTCFNGIYRVNRHGTFNVPRGDRSAVISERDDFGSVSRLLKRAVLRHADFETLIDAAQNGDLIFADPPYTVAHGTNGFIKYNETLFSWVDQVRLADSLERAAGRGVNVVATNADHSALRALYRGRGFVVRRLSRFSAVAADAAHRERFQELAILSKPSGGREQ